KTRGGDTRHVSCSVVTNRGPKTKKMHGRAHVVLSVRQYAARQGLALPGPVKDEEKDAMVLEAAAPADDDDTIRVVLPVRTEQTLARIRNKDEQRTAAARDFPAVQSLT